MDYLLFIVYLIVNTLALISKGEQIQAKPNKYGGHLYVPSDVGYGAKMLAQNINTKNANIGDVISGDRHQKARRQEAIRKRSIVRKQVLVISYYGAGYDVISDLIQLYPGSFHWPNPLSHLFEGIYQKYQPEQNMIFGGYKHRKSYKFANQTRKLLTEARKVLRDVMNCRLTSLGGAKGSIGLTERLPLNNSEKLNNAFNWYSNCMDQGFAHPDYRHQICMMRLRRRCLGSSIRIASPPQVSLQTATRLLAELPNVKVIHVVRDPREMIGTRNRTQHYYVTTFFDDVKYTCLEMVQDIDVYYDVIDYHPGRVIQLRVEDFFRDPLAVARVVYAFLGLTFPDHVVSRLLTWRRQINVRDLIQKWQSLFNKYEIQALKEKCGQAINILRY